MQRLLCEKYRDSQNEDFWTVFLCSLKKRGLGGVRLIIFDAHQGLKYAAEKVLSAAWRRSFVPPLSSRVVKKRSLVGERRLVGALVVEQTEEWHLTRRCMSRESPAKVFGSEASQELLQAKVAG